MIQKLKYALLAVIAAGVAATIYLSGIEAAFITCSPFLLFGLAVILCRSIISVSCALLALVIGLTFGLQSYYDAFRIHQGGEVDMVVLLVVPIAQATLGFLTLLIALTDRLICKLSHRKTKIA